MSDKYKATFNIERDSWDKFKEYCYKNNTTATAELNAFIETFSLEKEFDNSEGFPWDKMPASVISMQEAIAARLETYIDHRFDSLVERIENSNL